MVPQELAKRATAPGALCRWTAAGPSGWQGGVRVYRVPATVPPHGKLQGQGRKVHGNLSWASPGSDPPKHSTDAWPSQEPVLSTGRLRPGPRPGQRGVAQGWGGDGPRWTSQTAPAVLAPSEAHAQGSISTLSGVGGCKISCSRGGSKGCF